MAEPFYVFDSAEPARVGTYDGACTIFSIELGSTDRGQRLTLTGPAIAFVMLERACILAVGNSPADRERSESGTMAPTSLTVRSILKVQPVRGGGRWRILLGVTSPGMEEGTLLLEASSRTIADIGKDIEARQEEHWLPRST